MRPFRALVSAAAVFAMSGCAFLVNKAYDDIALNSDPSGAICRVERLSQPIGQISTPGTVRVTRSPYPIDIFCTKDGEAGARTVFPGIDPWTFANIPMGAGWYLIDSVTDGDREMPEAILVRFPVKQ